MLMNRPITSVTLFGTNGGEHKVTRKGRIDGDLGRFLVAKFPPIILS